MKNHLASCGLQYCKYIVELYTMVLQLKCIVREFNNMHNIMVWFVVESSLYIEYIFIFKLTTFYPRFRVILVINGHEV